MIGCRLYLQGGCMKKEIVALMGGKWWWMWLLFSIGLIALTLLAFVLEYKYTSFLLLVTIFNTCIISLLRVFEAKVAFILEEVNNRLDDVSISISYKHAELIGHTLIGVISVLVLVMWFFAFFDPRYYRYLISEDGILENASAVLWGCAAMLLAITIFRKMIHGQKFRGVSLELLLMIFFILCLGEEISWGQRILDLKTPAMLSAINVQNEITLHNIGSISVFSNLFFLIAIGFFLILPYLMNRSVRIHNLAHLLNLPVPHRLASIVFIVSIAGWVVIGLRFGTLGFHPFSFYAENYYNQMDDEVFELFSAFSYFAFSFINFGRKISVH